MIVICNPTDSPIKDYPIQNPQDKEVLLWSIGPGETLEFPDHVGKYLLQVYGFLQEVMTEDQLRERKEEEKKIVEGKVFTQVKIVKAEGEVVNPTPPPATGFTNANLQPHGEEIAKPPLPAKESAKGPSICPASGCGQEFKNQVMLKTHYAHKHLELPKGV